MVQMTDTLAQRVAEAIDYWLDSDSNEELNNAAKAAIEASGAQHLQGLVEVLKRISKAEKSGSNDARFLASIAIEALAALPPELRGEK